MLFIISFYWSTRRRRMTIKKTLCIAFRPPLVSLSWWTRRTERILFIKDQWRLYDEVVPWDDRDYLSKFRAHYPQGDPETWKITDSKARENHERWQLILRNFSSTTSSTSRSPPPSQKQQLVSSSSSSDGPPEVDYINAVDKWRNKWQKFLVILFLLALWLILCLVHQ